MAASVRDIIDTASAKYGRAWDAVQTALVKLIDKMIAQGMSAEKIVQVLGALDFDRLVGQTFGMDGATRDIQAAYRQVLIGTAGRGSVTEETLRALASFTRDSFLAQAGAMPARLKEEVIKAVLAGGRSSDVAAALSKLVERFNAETLANTALNTFSRSVEYEMAKQDPPDARYVYEGPIDEKTRDICLAMAAAGPLTLAEIDSRFPGAFVDGGGYNCRHSWIPVDAAREVDRAGANAAIDARGDRWSEPQTVRQAAAA